MAADPDGKTEDRVGEDAPATRDFTEEERQWYSDFYSWRDQTLAHIPVKPPDPQAASAWHIVHQLRRVVERDRARRKS